MIGVKQAIKAARDFVLDLYADQVLHDVFLEEVRRENGHWLITIGFRDPSPEPFGPAKVPFEIDAHGEPLFDSGPDRGLVRWPRIYKVVRVEGQTGAALEMVNRAA